jgi:hypothetical protein
MEDFYDVKLTEIDGQAVSLFGVFDGMVYNLAFSTPFYSTITCLPCFYFANLQVMAGHVLPSI